MDHEFQSQLEASFAELDGRQESMVDRLCRWCRQNSGSYNTAGLAAMSDILVDDFSELELPVQRVAGDAIHWIDETGQNRSQPSGDILIVQHNPMAAKRFLMMIHYDTVYPPDGLGSEVELIGDRKLKGPGTADAKGGLLVMLEAARTLRKYNLDQHIGWTMVANPDEEIGSPASSRWMRENAGDYEFGLLFEPTLPDGALVSSRKGSGNFTVIVRGRSAHAGRNPELGRNAIVHLCRLLQEIDALNRQIEDVSVNVAKVHGGTALNQVPDLAIGRFNVRVVDHKAIQVVVESIQRIVDRYNECEGYSVQLHGEFQSPPKSVTPQMSKLQQQVERACNLAGRSISWRSTGGACDGSKLAAAGLVNVDTLGPTGDGLHSADEWVDIFTLVPAVKTVVALVAHYDAQSFQYSSKS